MLTLLARIGIVWPVPADGPAPSAISCPVTITGPRAAPLPAGRWHAGWPARPRTKQPMVYLAAAAVGGLVRRGDHDGWRGGRQLSRAHAVEVLCSQACRLSRAGGRRSSSAVSRLSTARSAIARRVFTVADPRCGRSTALSQASNPG